MTLDELQDVTAFALTLPSGRSSNFWQLPLNAAWPGLLAQYGSIDPDRVLTVTAVAWRDRITIAQQATRGLHP